MNQSSLWATVFSGLLLLAVIAVPVVFVLWRELIAAAKDVMKELR